MSSVGFVGLGKLGLPVAYSLASRGLDVYGYDPFVHDPPENTDHETGLADIIEQASDRMRFVSLKEITARCDRLFIAVQTPHEPRFEGVTPLPEDRADFDYTYLTQAIKEIVAAADGKPLTVAVISTVLPGTMAREVQPLLPDTIRLVYCPSFIAMGTTVRDFLDPEFVLLGGDDDGTVRAVFDEAGITRTPFPQMAATVVATAIDNAELIKVAYNTFIGLKIAFANTLMEVCHKTGCDVDAVTDALKGANRRLISSAYLEGGMGDGGGCHPRDNIALSWLARELDLSHDLFEDIMRCREDQTVWLMNFVTEMCRTVQLPPAILGIAYKPNSHITTGSPALLLKNMLEQCPEMPDEVEGHDPHVEGATWTWLHEPRVFLVGCRHSEFTTTRFPSGSVVIDPFRYIPDQHGVEVIRLGQWAPVHTASSPSTNQTLAA